MELWGLTFDDWQLDLGNNRASWSCWVKKSNNSSSEIILFMYENTCNFLIIKCKFLTDFYKIYNNLGYPQWFSYKTKEDIENIKKQLDKSLQKINKFALFI